jgi:hypothetical protein
VVALVAGGVGAGTGTGTGTGTGGVDVAVAIGTGGGGVSRLVGTAAAGRASSGPARTVTPENTRRSFISL